MATKRLPWAEEHPFIDFRFNMERLPAETWSLLGECSSKMEHVMGTPLREDVAKELHSVFLIKGVHGTTAIEGNTLSEAEVKARLEGRLQLPKSQEYLGKEVDNIVAAYNYLTQQLREGVPYHFSPEDLRRLNAMVLDGLELPDDVKPGEYRTGRVVVGDYRSPSREYLEEMVALGCQFLNHEKWTTKFAGSFIIPILRAVLTHLYIAWMHPFGDGNGRTARLVEFDLLIRAGVPFSCAHLLSDYYNRTRHKYYRALSMARQDVLHFVCYAVAGLREMLLEQIGVIRQQQLEVTWDNHVYSVFQKTEDSVTSKRQREVLLALGHKTTPIRPEDIPNLSPKMARLYQLRTSRTLQRDIRSLRIQRLIVVGPEGVMPNLDLVRAFLPETGVALPPGMEQPATRGTKKTPKAS